MQKLIFGYYNEKIGCMSYNVKQRDEILIEGIGFITALYPNYDSDRLYDSDSNIYYNISMIEDSIRNVINSVPFEFYQMLIFDFIIGNTDRHHSNWAFIKKNDEFRFAPLYDNSSALCSHIYEDDIEKYLGNDEMKFNALINTKSKSSIRIDGNNKRFPTHIEVIKYLKKINRNDIINYVENVINILSSDCIHNIIYNFNIEFMSDMRKELLQKYLIGKINLLKEIFRKEDL